MNERWKDVVGYEDYFMVSDHGNVWSKRTSRFLKQNKLTTGYLCISSRIDGRKGQSIFLKVHRIVAEAFLDPPNNALLEWAENSFYGVVQVNHIDGDKENNYWKNLEWCNDQQNTQHALDNDLFFVRKGENNNNKLTEKDVIYIRKNYISRDRNFGARALGRKFNVDHSTIISALNGVTWKDT